MCLVNSTQKISGWDSRYPRDGGLGYKSIHESTSPLGKRCVGGLSWQPHPEMDSFQGKDMIGEEGMRREGICGDWGGKNFSIAWLSKP